MQINILQKGNVSLQPAQEQNSLGMASISDGSSAAEFPLEQRSNRQIGEPSKELEVRCLEAPNVGLFFPTKSVGNFTTDSTKKPTKLNNF